ncbi:MAG: methyltransferase domain-containing protein [Moraxellaceae bacterium]|nr:methyltransferase domain-containing protein [Pseudobdellovibrionaceae bacterium]
MSNYVIIDENGEIFLENPENKIQNPEICKEVLSNLQLNPDFTLTTLINDEIHLVEAFDFPITAHAVTVASDKVLIHTDFNLYFETQDDQWSVNAQDQFQGLTTTGAPFKLSKKAQDQLFTQCDEYDDDSFTLSGKNIMTPFYFIENKDIQKSQFWNESYRNLVQPRWDLNGPAEAFKDMLHRLKLPKSRILVLGCGAGHDAAFFAQAGHVVTGVDFSAEALQKAKKNYGHLHNLSFEQMNIFDLPQEWNFSFDVVIEHTLFCAIDPALHQKLITVWKRVLHEEGQLLSVFFTMFKRTGPPYGVTELELRALLRPHFQFLFWGRLRNSVPERLGKELFVLGKKR